VVGTTAGGTGAHVRMLAAGLAARGIAVSVVGPSAAGMRFGFGTLRGVVFTPVEFGDRPRPRDVAAVARVRRAVRDAGVVHAHGLRAGALTALALHLPPRLVRSGRRPGLVVTVHNAPPSRGGASLVIYRLLERLVARNADVVLCVSADLEDRLRAAGARNVGRAVVPAPVVPTAPDVPTAPGAAAGSEASATGRPLVLAAGRLTAQKDFGTLLDAAVSWRDMNPEPRLVIAGDGPLSGELRARAAVLGVDVAFLGHRDDVGDLLAAAAVFVLPSRWEGQPLVLAEALRAGVPIVATRVGGAGGRAGAGGRGPRRARRPVARGQAPRGGVAAGGHAANGGRRRDRRAGVLRRGR
jgi:glycosyltransferase involved in cell wall biosynthesis